MSSCAVVVDFPVPVLSQQQQQDVISVDEVVELISEELAAEQVALHTLALQAADMLRLEWAGRSIPEGWARERLGRLFGAYRGRP